MTQFNSFEDIYVWKKAHDTVLRTYNLRREHCFDREFAVKDQMRRPLIMLSSELQSQLRLARDPSYISETDPEKLNSSLVEVKKMISGFMNCLSSK